MPHAYTEDQLVEQPAIGLFAELAWQVAGPPTPDVGGEERLLPRQVVLATTGKAGHYSASQ